MRRARQLSTVAASRPVPGGQVLRVAVDVQARGRRWSHINQERLPRMPLTHVTFLPEPQLTGSAARGSVLLPLCPSLFLAFWCLIQGGAHFPNIYYPIFPPARGIHGHFEPLVPLFKHSSGELPPT